MTTELDSAMKSANTLLDMCGKLMAERDWLKAANAELAAALEAVVASRDNYAPGKTEKYCTDDLSGVKAHYWSPSASMVASEAIALARAALANHQKEQA